MLLVRLFPNVINTLAPCTDGEIDLYSGDSDHYGIVLVCINGTWSKICGLWSSTVDDNLASVFCSSLGFSLYGNM